MFKNLLVSKDATIKEAMRIIDRGRLGIAFVVDGKKIFGVVTDGDIRGAILKGLNINKAIKEIANLNPIVMRNKKLAKFKSQMLSPDDIKKAMPFSGSLKIPVIDNKDIIKGIVFRDKFLDLSLEDQDPIKRVLVVGGAGYLGSVLSRKLLKKGYSVRVLDNLTYGDRGIKELYKNKKFELIKGDIRHISDVIKAVNRADAVIHLAAIVGDPASSINPKETIEINYLSAKIIADICKFNQINRFLFASTCSVYGASQNPNERLNEHSFLNPVSLYAETKLRSEQGILSLSDDNFLPTIFRLATLYGVSPRMRFDLVINLLTAKAIREKKISIFGGDQWRPNLCVSDAAEACLRWLEAPIEKTGNQIFNVGGNKQNYKIIKIGEAIRNIIPKTEIEVKKEESDKRNYNVSFDKISKTLSFKPKKTIEQGIKDVSRFLKANMRYFNRPECNNHSFLSKWHYENK